MSPYEIFRQIGVRRAAGGLIVAAAAGLLVASANGQSFSACGPNICASSGANVGIGTSTPGRQLGIVGGGDTGIQLWSTGAPAQMGAWAMIAPTTGGFVLQNDSNAAQAFQITSYGNFSFSGGNVGIGTTSPQHLLHVAGTIGAEEVIVSATGADYVFQPGYDLQPLSGVAAYIQQQHHLPGIPSAAEMKEKGVDLGKMQTKLLAKIEELTLHMIDEEKQNNRLEQQNRELQERVARLEALEKQAQSAAK